MLILELFCGFCSMFYFFFESRGNKTDDPVVLWMTGGPGCASELALFYENGPFKINDDMSLAWNDYGWDKVCILAREY
jgi:serine carboxypeptidase-like clade 4